MQKAAPWEKKTEMSDPISPAQRSRSASLAGRPAASLAAHSAVAAFPLPPPRPAPVAGCRTVSLKGHGSDGIRGLNADRQQLDTQVITCWDPLLNVDLELHVCGGVPPEEI